jgi:hypothetical protein
VASLALVAFVTMVFAAMGVAALFAYWGEPFSAPPTPWFLWRFFTAIVVLFIAPILAAIYACEQ